MASQDIPFLISALREALATVEQNKVCHRYHGGVDHIMDLNAKLAHKIHVLERKLCGFKE